METHSAEKDSKATNRWSAPARWLAVILVCMAGCALIGLIVTRLMTPLYEARATVYVQREKPGFNLPENLPVNILQSSSNPVTYALVILKSRDFARSVINSSGLLTDRRFTQGEQIDMPAAIERLGRMVESEDDGEGLIVVTAHTRDPQLASELANTFIDSFSSKMVTANQTRRRYTGERIQQVEGEVSRLEERLKDLSERSDIADLDQQTKAAVERIADIESLLQQQNVQLRGLQSKLQTTGDVAELARLKGEQQALIVQRDQTAQDLGKIRSQMRGIPQVALERARLERELGIKGKLYQTLAEQHQIALINEKGEQGVYQIVDRAEAPRKPYRPDLFTNLVVSLLLGLLMGIAINLAGTSER